MVARFRDDVQMSSMEDAIAAILEALDNKQAAPSSRGVFVSSAQDAGDEGGG